MSSKASQPRYTINLHDTLSQEKHMNNGKEYPYFVVVKNVPFIIVVSSKGEAANFKKNTISARLLYDCEPRREVTLIRSAPVEYVTHISSNGEEITIESRIHVLTSQHEDSLFRVCVAFNDQEILSEPLKVISKADNARKPREKGSPTSSSIKKKRTASDAFGDVLHRIDSQQQEQRKIIDNLCEQNALLMSQLKQCTELLQQSSNYGNYCTPLVSDFTSNFIQPTTLLDEVLDFQSGTLFCDDGELLHLVPASPLDSISSTDSSPTSSPLRNDSIDGDDASRCDYLQL